jgi:hypothetical protein
MDNNLIDLISFQFFLSDLEIVVCVEVSLSEGDVPHTDVTSRVSNKESAIFIEDQAIGMDEVEHSRERLSGG